MKTVIIHDTPDEFGREIIAYLKKKAPHHACFIDLGEKSLQACNGCFGCWLKTPGLCQLKDDAMSVLAEEVRSDRVVYVCPVTWGGYSPAMKVYQDRALGRVLPFFKIHKGETHHPRRYQNIPQPLLAGYGNALDTDEIALFRRTGENLNDNIHRTAGQTLIIENKNDLTLFDSIWKGEEQ